MLLARDDVVINGVVGIEIGQRTPLLVLRGAVKGGTGGKCLGGPPMYRFTHPPFITTFMLIGWPPLHTKSFQRPYSYWKNVIIKERCIDAMLI